MADTKIEWADAVWNPVTGCTPISEGCQNCYAERMAKRLAGRCGYPADEPSRVTLHPEKLDEPLKRKKPRRVFVCSMGDLFHEDVPTWMRFEVLDIVLQAKQHTFLILTKRPANMKEYFDWYYTKCGRTTETIKNLWLGVTAENQEQADKRIPILLQIPAAVRFVSVEPMLGEVDLLRVNLGGNALLNSLTGKCTVYHPYGGAKTVKKSRGKLDWVVCGGESGPGARPMHPDWVRDLRDQCVASGTQFFFKQWGEFIPDDEGESDNLPWVSKETDRSRDRVIDMRGTDCTNWQGPNQVKPFVLMRRVGKKKAGRLLDGRTWDEIPVMK